MLRILYFSAVITLVGASAVAASGIEGRDRHHNTGAGLVLLTSLQR